MSHSVFESILEKDYPENIDSVIKPVDGHLPLSASLDRHGLLLAVGTMDGYVLIYDFLTRTLPVVVYYPHTGPITSLSWAHSSRQVASSSEDCRVVVVDISQDKPKKLFERRFDCVVRQVRFHPTEPNWILVSKVSGPPLLIHIGGGGEVPLVPACPPEGGAPRASPLARALNLPLPLPEPKQPNGPLQTPCKAEPGGGTPQVVSSASVPSASVVGPTETATSVPQASPLTAKKEPADESAPLKQEPSVPGALSEEERSATSAEGDSASQDGALSLSLSETTGETSSLSETTGEASSLGAVSASCRTAPGPPSGLPAVAYSKPSPDSKALPSVPSVPSVPPVPPVGPTPGPPEPSAEPPRLPTVPSPVPALPAVPPPGPSAPLPTAPSVVAAPEPSSASGPPESASVVVSEPSVGGLPSSDPSPGHAPVPSGVSPSESTGAPAVMREASADTTHPEQRALLPDAVPLPPSSDLDEDSYTPASSPLSSPRLSRSAKARNPRRTNRTPARRAPLKKTPKAPPKRRPGYAIVQAALKARRAALKRANSLWEDERIALEQEAVRDAQVAAYEAGQDLETPEPTTGELHSLAVEGAIATFSPSGDRILVGYTSGALALFETGSCACECVIFLAASSVMDVAFSPRGQHFLACYGDRIIRCFELQTHRCFHEFQDPILHLMWGRARFSTDGYYVIGAPAEDNNNSTMYIWSRFGELAKILHRPNSEGTLDFLWHPKRPMIVSVGTNGNIHTWDKTHITSWEAFAPDFKELEVNEFYQEREDEFDMERLAPIFKSAEECKLERAQKLIHAEEEEETLEVDIETPIEDPLGIPKDAYLLPVRPIPDPVLKGNRKKLPLFVDLSLLPSKESHEDSERALKMRRPRYTTHGAGAGMEAGAAGLGSPKVMRTRAPPPPDADYEYIHYSKYSGYLSENEDGQMEDIYYPDDPEEKDDDFTPAGPNTAIVVPRGSIEPMEGPDDQVRKQRKREKDRLRRQRRKEERERELQREAAVEKEETRPKPPPLPRRSLVDVLSISEFSPSSARNNNKQHASEHLPSTAAKRARTEAAPMGAEDRKVLKTIQGFHTPFSPFLFPPPAVAVGGPEPDDDFIPMPPRKPRGTVIDLTDKPSPRITMCTHAPQAPPLNIAGTPPSAGAVGHGPGSSHYSPSYATQGGRQAIAAASPPALHQAPSFGSAPHRTTAGALPACPRVPMPSQHPPQQTYSHTSPAHSHGHPHPHPHPHPHTPSPVHMHTHHRMHPHSSPHPHPFTPPALHHPTLHSPITPSPAPLPLDFSAIIANAEELIGSSSAAELLQGNPILVPVSAPAPAPVFVPVSAPAPAQMSFLNSALRDAFIQKTGRQPPERFMQLMSSNAAQLQQPQGPRP